VGFINVTTDLDGPGSVNHFSRPVGPIFQIGKWWVKIRLNGPPARVDRTLQLGLAVVSGNLSTAVQTLSDEHANTENEYGK
jgi:hypothetical protein